MGLRMPAGVQKLALIAGLALLSALGHGWATPVFAQQSKLSASSDPGELWAFVKRMDARIKTDPQAKYYAGKGQALEWLGKLKEAGDEYSEAIKRAPSNRDYLVCRARVQRRRGLWRQGERDYGQAISLGDRTSEVFSGRGRCRLSLKDYKSAMSDAARAIELGSNDPMDWYVKGSASYHLRQYKNALSDLNSALKLDPNNAAFLRTRGRIFQKLDRAVEAEADFSLARELGTE